MSKDYEIKRQAEVIRQQQYQINQLKQQVLQTQTSIRDLINAQTQQEDLHLESVQRYNEAEEKLMIVNKHYFDCKTQLEYFKSKYDSFIKSAHSSKGLFTPPELIRDNRDNE